METIKISKGFQWGLALMLLGGEAFQGVLIKHLLSSFLIWGEELLSLVEGNAFFLPFLFELQCRGLLLSNALPGFISQLTSGCFCKAIKSGEGQISGLNHLFLH